MPISADDLMQGIRGPLKGFVIVECNPLQDGWHPLAEDFWLACELVGRVIGTPRQVNVVLATSPFSVTLNAGEFRFTSREGVINVHLKGFVFLDANKMRDYDRPLRVAAILEELVHCLLNIQDEELVKHVVAWLYDGIEYREGLYRPKRIPGPPAPEATSQEAPGGANAVGPDIGVPPGP